MEKDIEKDSKNADKYKEHKYKDKDGNIKYGGTAIYISKDEYTYSLNEFNEIINDEKDK
jgi:hypothetical protein